MQRIEKIYFLIIICLIFVSNLLSFTLGVDLGMEVNAKIKVANESQVTPKIETYIEEEPEPEPEPEPKTVIEEYRISDEEIELIALITLAEAENQPELGQRLVIDTILNRMDHEKHWPDTVKGVVYMKNAFSCTFDGRIERCSKYFKGDVKEKLIELVKEELVQKTNDKVVYFRGGKYSDYGTPYEKVGDHYFSTL